MWGLGCGLKLFVLAGFDGNVSLVRDLILSCGTSLVRDPSNLVYEIWCKIILIFVVRLYFLGLSIPKNANILALVIYLTLRHLPLILIDLYLWLPQRDGFVTDTLVKHYNIDYNFISLCRARLLGWGRSEFLCILPAANSELCSCAWISCKHRRMELTKEPVFRGGTMSSCRPATPTSFWCKEKIYSLL
jgi:hypothetical protein